MINKIEKDRLYWWTWIMPFLIFQSVYYLSVFLETVPGSSLVYFPKLIAFVLIVWWGPRVLPSVFISRLFISYLSGLENVYFYPIYSAVETGEVFLSWLFYMKILKGNMKLPDLKSCIVFAFFGIILPVTLGVILKNTLYLYFDIIRYEDYLWSIFVLWISDILGGISISASFLNILYDPMKKLGLILSEEDDDDFLLINNKNRHKKYVEIILVISIIIYFSFSLDLGGYLWFYGLFGFWLALRYGIKGAVMANIAIFIFVFALPAAEDKLINYYVTIHKIITQGVVNLTALSFGIFITGRIISDNKRVQDEIFREKIFTEKLLDMIPAVFYMFDKDGRFRKWNKRFTDELGYSDDELRNLTIKQFITNKNDYELIETEMNKIFTNKKNRMLEFSVSDKNGIEVPYILSGSYIETSHGAMIMGLGVNVSGLKQKEIELQNEEIRLRTLIDTIPDLVWLKDIRGYYLMCNKRFEEFFGASEEEIKGKTDYDFVDKELADLFRENDRKAKEKNSFNVNLETVTFANDGHKSLLETTKMPLYDNKGVLVGILGIARDISVYKKHEDELLDYKAHLEKLVEKRAVALEEMNKELIIAREYADKAEISKNIFLENMSHEMLSPFNSIIGFSKMIRRDESLSNDSFKKINIVIDSAQQLLQIINKVLEVSKTGSSHLELNEKKINMGSFISEIKSIAEGKRKDKNIVFTVSNLSPEAEFIEADEVKLKQILFNILDNSFKYTLKGSVKLNFSVETNEGFTNLLCSVEDTGIGIEESRQSAIFEPFERIVNYDNLVSGAGVGLTIVRNYLRVMNGSISLKSEKDKGSLFTVKIPVKVFLRDGKAEACDKKRRYRILIVGNSPDTDMIDGLLNINGLNVRKVNDGLEGIKSAVNWLPDIIFVDDKLSIVDSFGVIKHIREIEECKGIKVILLSSGVSDKDNSAKDRGADDIIFKPAFYNDIMTCFIKYFDLKLIGEVNIT